MLSGKPINIVAWGWSTESPDEAQQRGHEAAQRVAKRLRAGEPFPDSYGYLDRPPREEILEEITADDGSLIAVITRNTYGSLVLNANDLMFIDIDTPRESSLAGFIRVVKRLFGQVANDNASGIVQKISEFAAARPDLTFRLYRTFAGFRCVISNKRLDPKGSEALSLFESLDADPLYVTLCKNQESFRARLTPKFWRCGAERPPYRFPLETEDQERRFASWERKYDVQIGNYATCAFVRQFGSHEGPADLRRLVELHDRITKANSGLRLA